MLRYNRNRARGRFFPLFSPRELFYGSVPGAWYDPTDLSTLFQDSAGTTPVTAVEQPVGLVLDKSGNANHATQATAASRPTYRARYNLLTFSEEFDTAAWFKNANTITSNATTAPDGTTTADKLVETAVNNTHEIQQSVTTIAASYTFSAYIKAAGRAFAMLYHSQSNSAQVVNLTTGALAGNAGLGAPVSASVSSAGNGWFRVSMTVNATAASNQFRIYPMFDATTFAYLGDGTSGLFLWGAQLLTAADATATGNAYQRIAAATVYDTAPIFRPYLAFDGIDDGLVTSPIDFTSTDKVTIFSGLNKQTDSAPSGLGLVVELSANVSTNAGTFLLAAPHANLSPSYGWYSRGTAALVAGTTVGFPSPTTNVLTAIGDIAGDILRLRANGTQVINVTTDQGAGNYGNYLLAIGRRSGASFPFNGRIYELIVRGAASSTTEIADTELWVNARTGAY